MLGQDPGAREQRPHLPDRRDARQGVPVRRRGRGQRRLQGAVPGAARRLGESDAGGGPEPAPSELPRMSLPPPSPLARPLPSAGAGARRSSRCSSSSRSTTCSTRRCRPRSRDFTCVFDWAWSNYSDAISQFHEQFFRSLVYAGIATALALADQLSARVLDRDARRALEEPAAALHHRAVLRHLPDPHARLAHDPLRRRRRRRHPADTRRSSATTGGCSRPRRP